MSGLPASPSVFPVTVIVPAFNEAGSIADTIASIQAQSFRPADIVVVDDCSTDGTGDIARSFGVRVICPERNTGSKAGAQSFALSRIDTEFCLVLDGDTILAPDVIEQLAPAFDDPAVAAACTTVLPRRLDSVWERGRYVEYLFAFTFYKPVQDQWGAPMISSGCCSMYRTAAVRAAGGWSARTLAEDMDLTWTLCRMGWQVRFMPAATCYPLEPSTWVFLSRQLRRWSHGYVQNVRLHWRGLLEVPFLRSAVAVATWDAAVASLLYLLVLPLLAIGFRNPWFLLGYVIDIPAIVVPVVAGAIPRGQVLRALGCLPAFFALRTVNALFFLRALWLEWIRGRTLLVYEKGH